MAVCAWCCVIGGMGELSTMNILVTFLALTWGRVKVGISELRAHVGGLVAVDAGHRPVRAYQRELGLCMVKLG